jgi:hypothetical protein
MTERAGTHPLWLLSDSDLEVIVRLVLSSGSLKMLAQSYRVSYPTIRARLNGVIERLKYAIESERADPMSAILGELVGRGELTAADAQEVLEIHRQECQKERGRAVCEPEEDE